MFPSKRLDRPVPVALVSAPHADPPIAAPDGFSALQSVLQHLADETRANGRAHHAVLRVALDDAWSRVLSALSLSEKYADWNVADPPIDVIDVPRRPLPRMLRLTHDEMMADPAWKAHALAVRNRPPLRGCLAVPLYDRHGRNFGMIELTDKEGGDFNADDENRVLKFAKIVSLAVENACLFQSAHDAQASPHQPPHMVPCGAETILLAEDDELVRSLTSHVLDLGGYHVLEASDGEAALALAQHHAGPIHLLVTDVIMPRLGGRPLADRLLSLHPHLKVLFISGHTADAILRHGVQDSDFSFLQKPFSTTVLAQKVRDILDLPA